jgi:hypothetical protein
MSTASRARLALSACSWASAACSVSRSATPTSTRRRAQPKPGQRLLRSRALDQALALLVLLRVARRHAGEPSDRQRRERDDAEAKAPHRERRHRLGETRLASKRGPDLPFEMRAKFGRGLV